MSEKELTREITEPEELQAEEEKCATAADSQLNIAPAEQSSESFEIPAEIFQKQQENEADLKKWKKRIRKRLTGFTSLLRQKEAENEKLLVETRILEENEKILNQQNRSLTGKVAHLQRFIEEKQQELRNLNQERYELDCRVDDDEYDKEAELAFLTAEINIVQRTLHTLQERNKFLLDQNSHSAAVLTQVKSHRDKRRRRTLQLKGDVQNLKNEIRVVEYQIMKTEYGKKKLNREIADKQYQIDDLTKGREIRRQKIQDLKDQLSLLQEEKILADSEETMNPAAEPPPNSGYEVDCRVDDEYDKEAELAFLTAEINTVQRTLHTLQERKTFLLDQNSHTAAVLTQVESHRDKRRRRTLQLKGAVQNLKNENREAEYQIMKTKYEKKKLNRKIADKQNQIDDLIKGREIRRQKIQALKDQPSLLQKKKILADSEETMNPAAEPPPNSGSWFPSAKGLLVGLGVAVGGLLIHSAFRAS